MVMFMELWYIIAPVVKHRWEIPQLNGSVTSKLGDFRGDVCFAVGVQRDSEGLFKIVELLGLGSNHEESCATADESCSQKKV